MSPVVVADDGINVKVSWTPLTTTEENGSPVTKYRISIFNRTTSLWAYTSGTLCNGEDPAIIAQNYCLIDMLDFISKLGYQIT